LNLFAANRHLPLQRMVIASDILDDGEKGAKRLFEEYGSRLTAAAALSAAMAVGPLAAASGDEYQFIISGDPIAASTEGSSSASSGTGPLTGGPLADGTVFASELEARYRTMDGKTLHEEIKTLHGQNNFLAHKLESA
jgi:hypothetical protein